MLAATVPDSEPAFAELCPEYGIGSARLSFAAPRGGSALPPHEARPSLGEYKLGRCDATVQQKFGPGYRFLDHNSTDFADHDQNPGTGSSNPGPSSGESGELPYWAAGSGFLSSSGASRDRRALSAFWTGDQ